MCIRDRLVLVLTDAAVTGVVVVVIVVVVAAAAAAAFSCMASVAQAAKRFASSAGASLR